MNDPTTASEIAARGARHREAPGSPHVMDLASSVAGVFSH
jgi:hypothetical protein